MLPTTLNLLLSLSASQPKSLFCVPTSVQNLSTRHSSSLPRSRFLDVTRALRDIQKTAVREAMISQLEEKFETHFR